MPVEEWETKSACTKPGVDPRWFESGADETQAATAKWLCNRRCPVKTECRDDALRRAQAGKEVHGIRAGEMWTFSGRSDRPLTEGEERRCAAPGCSNVFMVTGKNSTKKVCSTECARKIRPPRTYSKPRDRRRKKPAEA